MMTPGQRPRKYPFSLIKFANILRALVLPPLGDIHAVSLLAPVRGKPVTFCFIFLSWSLICRMMMWSYCADSAHMW